LIKGTVPAVPTEVGIEDLSSRNGREKEEVRYPPR
jgi:hypothetical protein